MPKRRSDRSAAARSGFLPAIAYYGRANAALAGPQSLWPSFWEKEITFGRRLAQLQGWPSCCRTRRSQKECSREVTEDSVGRNQSLAPATATASKDGLEGDPAVHEARAAWTCLPVRLPLPASPYHRAHLMTAVRDTSVLFQHAAASAGCQTTSVRRATCIMHPPLALALLLARGRRPAGTPGSGEDAGRRHRGSRRDPKSTHDVPSINKRSRSAVQ